MLVDRRAEIHKGLVPIPDYKIIHIWQSPDASGIGPEQLKLNFVDVDRFYPRDIQEEINVLNLELEEDPGKRDGVLLAYRGERIEGNNLVLDVSLTTYSAFLVTNWRRGKELWEDGRKDVLSDGMVITAIVVSADNDILMGIRAREIELGGAKIGLFGGMLNTDEEVKFVTKGLQKGSPVFRMIDAEISKEVGVPLEILTKTFDTRLDSLVRDGEKHCRPNLFFISQSDLTTQELEQFFGRGGDKDEHTSIIALPNNTLAIKSFLQDTNSEMLTESTKTGLRLQLRRLKKSSFLVTHAK